MKYKHNLGKVEKYPSANRIREVVLALSHVNRKAGTMGSWVWFLDDYNLSHLFECDFSSADLYLCLCFVYH